MTHQGGVTLIKLLTFLNESAAKQVTRYLLLEDNAANRHS